MELYLEIFFSKIANGKIVYTKNLVTITDENTNPDELVYQTLKEEFPHLAANQQTLLIHSTSWRFEKPAKLIVTYLVYSEEFCLGHRQTSLMPLEHLAIAKSDQAQKPRPNVLEDQHVISHAFRHLSFLVKNDPAVEKVLSRNRQTFEEIGLAVAGGLSA